MRLRAIAALLALACVGASSIGAATGSGRIAYSSRAWPANAGDNWEIWVLGADGTGRHDVGRNTSCDDASPAWSPTGTRIAFVCQLITDAHSALRVDHAP